MQPVRSARIDHPQRARRRSPRLFGALVCFSAVLGVGIGIASAYTAVEYRGTSTPLPHAPSYAVSSSSLNQSLYKALLIACSSGTWTKYINIENSNGPQFVYQSTGCGWTGPVSYAVALSRSACTSMSAGTWYATCWIHRV
jgi:hypothetical protein